MRQSSRERREQHHARCCFSCPQVGRFLAALNFRHHVLDAIFLDHIDEALELKCRRFAGRLRLDRSHELKSKAPCKVGPCRMMNDHATIWYVTKSIIEFGAELIQFPKVRSLISPEFYGVG